MRTHRSSWAAEGGEGACNGVPSQSKLRNNIWIELAVVMHVWFQITRLWFPYMETSCYNGLWIWILMPPGNLHKFHAACGSWAPGTHYRDMPVYCSYAARQCFVAYKMYSVLHGGYHFYAEYSIIWIFCFFSGYKLSIPKSSRSATSSPVLFTSATPQQLASQHMVCAVMS